MESAAPLARESFRYGFWGPVHQIYGAPPARRAGCSPLRVTSWFVQRSRRGLVRPRERDAQNRQLACLVCALARRP